MQNRNLGTAFFLTLVLYDNDEEKIRHVLDNLSLLLRFGYSLNGSQINLPQIRPPIEEAYNLKIPSLFRNSNEKHWHKILVLKYV